jgi:hypothetical protein
LNGPVHNGAVAVGPRGGTIPVGPPGNFYGGKHADHSHHHHDGFPVFGFGYGGPSYYYDDYPYYYSSCFVEKRRVHTPHGWRLRPVRVCY